MTRSLRVAVANWTDRIAGGTETYISRLIVRLRDLGHQVMLVHEASDPAGRALIDPAAEASCDAGVIGRSEAVRQVRAWQPDVVLQNHALDPLLEEALLDLGPAVLMGHAYYGTCISGTKTWQSVPRPCVRTLGAGCLLHYYPHHCGGWSPVTMLDLYRLQTMRKALLRRYRVVLTLSAHMEQEYLRHGARARWAPLVGAAPSVVARKHEPGSPWTVLFVGRMQSLKGGHLLIEAAARVVQSSGASLDLVMIGDGPDRAEWEALAARHSLVLPRLRVRFPGWLTGNELREQWRSGHLFAFPSIWPEPLGLTGVDASEQGIPSVAFSQGAVTEWLRDGVNGMLAESPPSASSLAAALERVIESDEGYSMLAESTASNCLFADYATHARDLSSILTAAAQGQK